MFYSSGSFTFKNATLSTTLFSIDSAGSVSFNSMIYPAGGVSSAGNITSFATLSGANVVEGGVALSSKYLTSASLNNYVLKAGDTMTGNLKINSSTQLAAKILLTGQEFFQAATTSTDGIAMLLLVNRLGNRQIGFAGSANLLVNATNPILLITPNSVDCLSTNGTRLQTQFGGVLYTGANGVNIGMNTISYKSAATVLTISGASSGSAQPIVQIIKQQRGMVITLFRLKDMLI